MKNMIDIYNFSLPSCINLYGSLESVAINNQHSYIPNLIRHLFQICLTCCVIFLSLAAACCPAQFQAAYLIFSLPLNSQITQAIPSKRFDRTVKYLSEARPFTVSSTSDGAKTILSQVIRTIRNMMIFNTFLLFIMFLLSSLR